MSGAVGLKIITIPNIDRRLSGVKFHADMNSARRQLTDVELDQELAEHGLRRTEQRRVVYSILSADLDHPTAQDVYVHARLRMPDISLATVYNCLEALVACGLVRRVQVDPAASRFCPNMREHGHFYCDECGSIYDIEIQTGRLAEPGWLPAGFRATRYDVSMRGVCSVCERERRVRKSKELENL